MLKLAAFPLFCSLHPLLFKLPAFLLFSSLQFSGYTVRILLLLPSFFLLGIQELLRDTTGILLGTEKMCPKLFHELPCIFLHKPSK